MYTQHYDQPRCMLKRLRACWRPLLNAFILGAGLQAESAPAPQSAAIAAPPAVTPAPADSGGRAAPAPAAAPSGAGGAVAPPSAAPAVPLRHAAASGQFQTPAASSQMALTPTHSLGSVQELSQQKRPKVRRLWHA